MLSRRHIYLALGMLAAVVLTAAALIASADGRQNVDAQPLPVVQAD